MNNLVLYFSGTGNCLKIAKTIKKELDNADIVSIAKSERYVLAKQYESIGFIYPVYFWGLPKKVISFIENLDLGNNKNAYFYSIASYGGDIGNGVYQIYELLQKKHGVKINSCQKLVMFSNYVINHDISERVDEITKKSNDGLVPIIDSIKNRRNNKVNKFTKIFSFVNKWFVKNVSAMDRHFTVSDNCTGCGICQKVCPAKNIVMENNKPRYNHNCEQCLACLHFCPQKAINYKNLTQNRRRYTNPDISYRELSEFNNNER